ncbi:hypothetical protein GJ496_009327 [Pomphorhynchus laevis]|nr:hypothetical protein GJ496_009327 [Pomphorhynchus laevis]
MESHQKARQIANRVLHAGKSKASAFKKSMATPSVNNSEEISPPNTSHLLYAPRQAKSRASYSMGDSGLRNKDREIRLNSLRDSKSSGHISKNHHKSSSMINLNVDPLDRSKSQSPMLINKEKIDKNSMLKSKSTSNLYKSDNVSGDTASTKKHGFRKVVHNPRSEKLLFSIENKIFDTLKAGIAEGVSRGVGIPVNRFNSLVDNIVATIRRMATIGSAKSTEVDINGDQTDDGNQQVNDKSTKTATQVIFNWIYIVADKGNAVHEIYTDEGLLSVARKVTQRVLVLTSDQVRNLFSM